MHRLFADGLNSVVHALLGALGLPPAALLFVAYQLAQGGRDTPVDLGEFAAGYLLRAILSP